MSARSRPAAELHPLLQRLAEVLSVDGRGRLVWFGIQTTLGEDALEQLAGHLYAHFYVTGGPTPVVERPYTPPSAAFKRELARRSRARNAHRQLTLVSSDAAFLYVRDGDLELRIPKAALREQAQVADGILHLVVPTASFTDAPGFLYLRGSGMSLVRDEPIVRIYWNLTPAQALWWIGALPDPLDATGAAWEVKVLDEPAEYYRADAAVLYVAREAWPVVAQVVADVHDGLPGARARAVPATTLEVAQGVGLAEDPGTGASYGEWLCFALARGVLDAARARSSGARAGAVAAAIRAVGGSPRAPHSRRGGTAYKLPPPRPRSGKRAPARRSGISDPATAAFEIALALHNQAVFFGGRATWVAPSQDVPTHAASIDELLYDGAAGMALFFAAVAAADGGDPRWSRAAHAAGRQAVARLDRAPMTSGFHGGAGGVAWAMVRAGSALDSDELRELGLRLAAEPARRNSSRPRI